MIGYCLCRGARRCEHWHSSLSSQLRPNTPRVFFHSQTSRGAIIVGLARVSLPPHNFRVSLSISQIFVDAYSISVLPTEHPPKRFLQPAGRWWRWASGISPFCLDYSSANFCTHCWVTKRNPFFCSFVWCVVQSLEAPLTVYLFFKHIDNRP